MLIPYDSFFRLGFDSPPPPPLFSGVTDLLGHFWFWSQNTVWTTKAEKEKCYEFVILSSNCAKKSDKHLVRPSNTCSADKHLLSWQTHAQHCLFKQTNRLNKQTAAADCTCWSPWRRAWPQSCRPPLSGDPPPPPAPPPPSLAVHKLR